MLERVEVDVCYLFIDLINLYILSIHCIQGIVLAILIQLVTTKGRHSMIKQVNYHINSVLKGD